MLNDYYFLILKLGDVNLSILNRCFSRNQFSIPIINLSKIPGLLSIDHYTLEGFFLKFLMSKHAHRPCI